MGFFFANSEPFSGEASVSSVNCSRLTAQPPIGAPFGKAILSTKYWDAETKTVAYQLRDYGPGVGKWLARDPMGDPGFDRVFPAEFRARLLTDFNKYEFAGNDGANNVDPFGDTYGPIVPVEPPPSKLPPPIGAPPSGECRIEICCKPVGPIPRGHCVIRFTDSNGKRTGCRGGPSGGIGGSGSGDAKGRKPVQCKGCCGDWGSIITACGKGNALIDDAAENGLDDDLNDARLNPSHCMFVTQSAQACNIKTCIEREMTKIESKCYKYAPVGPNSSTAVYSSLASCLGATVPNPPGRQPGWREFNKNDSDCLK